MQTPVALIIFNRPHTTQRVFDEIARVKPQKLFVIADGPRADRPDDSRKCSAARAIIENVSWECDVLKNYSDINLGCGIRPATGISWVFEHVDRAIILEDDCIPHPTFFRFCEELLERYRHDERVMHVAGNNFQFGNKRGLYSYFFSFENIAWGWATWRRAWKYFDIGVKLWPEFRDSNWLDYLGWSKEGVNYYREKFERAYYNPIEIDYWDYQWTFACWAHNGLSILPNNTLVTNVGFGQEDATHTKTKSKTSALPLEEMKFPLNHPPYVLRNMEADQFFIDTWFQPAQKRLIERIAQKLYRLCPDTLQKCIRQLLRVGFRRN